MNGLGGPWMKIDVIGLKPLYSAGCEEVDIAQSLRVVEAGAEMS